MISSTSGFFVPPTCGRSGRSQYFVHAIGVAFQALRVSVTEGTRLTILIALEWWWSIAGYSRSLETAISGMMTHGCFDSHHTSTSGEIDAFSSRVPDLTMTISRRPVGIEMIGEPQFPQKCRSTCTVPDGSSPGSPYIFMSPLTVKLSAAVTRLTENAPPLWRWQWSQWQTAVLMTSPVIEYVTWPQRQRPVIDMLWW